AVRHESSTTPAAVASRPSPVPAGERGSAGAAVWPIASSLGRGGLQVSPGAPGSGIRHPPKELLQRGVLRIVEELAGGPDFSDLPLGEIGDPGGDLTREPQPGRN